jgi:hypothetical protein
LRPNTHRVGRAVSALTAAVVLSGCSGGGASSDVGYGGRTSIDTPNAHADSGAAPTASGSQPGTAIPVPVEPSTALAPPEFAHSAAWSTTITLSREGLAAFGGSNDPDRGAPATDWVLVHEQFDAGLVALAGDVLVAPMFSAGESSQPATESLAVQFLDVKTGRLLATHALPGAVSFYGLDSVTIAGRPAVEVRYLPKPSATSTGVPPAFTSVVLDTTGRQLWTSAGQRIASGAMGPDPGLYGGPASGLVRDGGFLLRHNASDPADYRQRAATTSLTDLAGKTLLTIPDYASFDQTDPAKTDRNAIQLIGGYAVVMATDPAAAAKTAGVQVTPERFTVYDLVHGARKVADVTEPSLAAGSGLPEAWGQVLAACGDRLLLYWPTAGTSLAGGGSATNLTVLDVASGRTTAPITFTSNMEGALAPLLHAVTDPSCSAVHVAGTVGVGRPAALAVNWSTGQALWQQSDPNPSYQQPNTFTVASPLIVHSGTVYGVQASGPSGGLQPVSLGLADGKTRSTGFSLIPVAFTSAGAPIFLQIDGANSATATAPPPSVPPPSVTASSRPSTTVSTPPSTSGSPSRNPGASSPPDLYSVTMWVGSPTR